MNEQKNLILAIVLSAVVLFGWSAISERYFPTANPPATKIEDGKEVVIPKPGADPAADTITAIRDRATVLGETPRVPIRTDRLTGSINLTGARIDDLVLTNYRETIAKGSPNIRLLSPSGSPKAYFAGFGWSGASGLPGPDTVWQAPQGAVLSVGKPVTLTSANAGGQSFAITIAIDEDYMFTVTQRVTNGGTQALVARPYGLVSRVGASTDPDSWTAHVGPMGVFDDRVNDVNWEDVREAANRTMDFTSTGGWLGFSDKYWLTALVAGKGTPIEASFRQSSGDRFQADAAGKPAIVGPGQAASSSMRLFAGAKETALLDHYMDDTGVPLFDRAIDWGWFDFIAKPIFYLLDWLFRMFGNFGVAIIGLTVIVRILLFPIANKQFASMARMRQIQPRMKAIQERHKEDKLRMQQEMMALYKTEKVNPMAGCLPILLQIPIFYALYKVLLLTIEMRHQPFVLWIRDLSAPDPMTPLNLFGLLDFTPPQFIAIGVLPILLGITMWLQQKLNPQPMDEIQAKVFGIMPWIFMFIMAPFAAGLQLYWTVNNIISIGQQYVLIRKHPAPAADTVIEATATPAPAPTRPARRKK
ncbi:membrane protein insertase YidC [Sphingoaurantiacus capsulatus]|uniref:Membrane protein insertase YidC n=1 Tax=Sphingoaurantiacus capsulatus TaxID=1771310 RepID=A0ABV7XCM9_9SPHN